MTVTEVFNAAVVERFGDRCYELLAHHITDVLAEAAEYAAT